MSLIEQIFYDGCGDVRKCLKDPLPSPTLSDEDEPFELASLIQQCVKDHTDKRDINYLHRLSLDRIMYNGQYALAAYAASASEDPSLVKDSQSNVLTTVRQWSSKHLDAVTKIMEQVTRPPFFLILTNDCQ
jgi:hypothetical protein